MEVNKARYNDPRPPNFGEASHDFESTRIDETLAEEMERLQIQNALEVSTDGVFSLHVDTHLEESQSGFPLGSSTERCDDQQGLHTLSLESDDRPTGNVTSNGQLLPRALMDSETPTVSVQEYSPSQRLSPSTTERPTIVEQCHHRLLHRQLHCAVETDDKVLFQSLLDEQSDINQIDEKTGESALALAIILKREEITYILLSHGADYLVKLKPNKTLTLLEAAAKNFPKALDHANSSPINQNLSTPAGLHLFQVAQSHARPDILRTIISQSNPLTTGKIIDQESTLRWAIQNSDKDFTDFIITSGANISSRYPIPGGWELPVHLSSRQSSYDHTSVLLSHGADILSRDSRNQIPLHHAVAKAPSEIVRNHFEETKRYIVRSYPAASSGSFMLERMSEECIRIACRTGDVSKLKLMLELAPHRSAVTQLELLHISIQYARQETTVYLLNKGYSPTLRHNGKLPDEVAFIPVKKDWMYIDNDVEDYAVCKELVAQARREDKATRKPLSGGKKTSGIGGMLHVPW